MRGRAENATSLPRYFGLGKGLTFYTWTSDQYSQYGSKVISSTVRDATYIRDEILDNQTDLPILEHTTDTAGYTELVFALFDLLGLQFAPRIRDLGAQRLYRLDSQPRKEGAGTLLKGVVDRQRILQRWDDLLRVAGSLKLGWITASLLISKLQAGVRQNALTRALREYGPLVKTCFIPPVDQERRLPPTDLSTAEQRRSAARPAPLPLLRPRGQGPAPPRGRAVLESARARAGAQRR